MCVHTGFKRSADLQSNCTVSSQVNSYRMREQVLYRENTFYIVTDFRNCYSQPGELKRLGAMQQD